MSVLELIETIAGNLDKYNVQECLQDIGKNVLDFLGAESCIFFLYDHNQKEFYVAKAMGKPALRDERVRLPMGMGISGYVAEKRKPLFIGDIQKPDDTFKQIQCGAQSKYLPEICGKCRTVLALPLVAFSDLIGVIEIIDSKPNAFSDAELASMQPLVNIAALAIPRSMADSSLAKLAEISVRFLEEKDRYTHGHSLRVMKYSLLLADELQLPKQVSDELRVCALLHDIGKVIMKDSILSKKDTLLRSEFDTIKMHPAIGSSIARKISTSIADKILAHHESYDGSGYPSGLSGRNIPMVSRIISIADTFDAITTTRPYRESKSLEEAMKEIHLYSGIQFDPLLVSAFLRLAKEGKLRVESV